METADLAQAVFEGDFSAVRRLLDQGADPNAFGAGGSTALLAASAQGKTKLVELLLDHGADPNLANGQGATPLHAAIQRAKMATVQLLLNRGADVDAATANGSTALLTTVLHGRLKLVQCILDAGADPNIAYRENDTFLPHLTKGVAPLHLAAHSGKLDLAEALLKAGADPNQRDDRGRTPLDVAESQGFGDLIDHLRPLTQGANDRRADAKSLAPRLFRAALAGRAQEVADLSAQGADPNSADPNPTEQGRTALIVACQEGHLDCVRVLLEAGADVERSTLENAWLGRSRTPLITAAVEGRVEIVRALLKAGACVDAADSAGDTPLVHAAEAGQAAVVRLLLEAGADPYHQPAGSEGDDGGGDGEEETDAEAAPLDALSKALDNDHEDVLEEFLRAGATPSPQALSIAARRGRFATVRRLLDLGLDPRAAGPEGGTPLHAACSLQTTVLERDPKVSILDTDSERYLAIAAPWQMETVGLLLDRGADPNARDSRGRTPLHVAAGMETMVTYRHVRNPEDAAKHTSSEIDTAPLVQLLLDRGANPNVQDRDGLTPLIRACRAGDWGASPRQVVATLLKAGADVNLRDAEGRSALFPEHRMEADLLKALLKAGADVHVRDAKGQTPLLRAVEMAYDDLAILRLLIQAGSDVNARDDAGQFAMDMAQERQAGKVVKLLAKAGAVAAPQANRQLYDAVAEGDAAKARAALRDGADPHALFHGYDALRMAIAQGKSDMVALLLEAGANADHRSDHVSFPTPLFAALQNEPMGIDPPMSLNVVRMLLEAGANPNALNRRGRSPLTFAAWAGRRDWIEALSAAGADVGADPLSQDFLNVIALAERAEAAEFAQAIAIVKAETGAEPKTIEWRPGLRAFFVTANQETDEAMRAPEAAGWSRFGIEWGVLDKKVRDLCRDLRAKLAPLGASVVDLGRPIGSGPSGKFVVLLPSVDPFTALAACGPSPGGDYGGPDGGGLALPDVLAWFRDLETRIPFTIWGAGRDFVEVEFERPIPEEESRDLASRIYEFCPDSVNQGAGTKAKLARNIRETRRVFFWWD